MTKILKNPITLFAGIALGILIGIFIKPLIPFLSPISEIYLSLLQMCVLPMVACTICINIGTVFSGKLEGIIGRWIICVLTVLILAAAIGAGVAFMMRGYMTPDAAAKGLLAQMQGDKSGSTLDRFTRLEFYGVNTPPPQEQASVVDFFLRIVPSNIFNALANGHTIQVIMFFIVLGVMMTKISPQKSTPILHALDGVYSALCRFVDYLLLLLPFTMCAMLAVQFSSNEMSGMAGPLLRLLMVILIAMVCLMAATFFIIQSSARCTLIQHWRSVKRMLMITFGTRSCLAAIPVALEDCPEELGLDRTLTNAILPIGITMCQSGVIASAAIAAVFATTIYDVSLNIPAIAIILLGSVLFSISAIGVPGIVAVGMLGIILEPLGIPSEIIIIVYLAAIPFFDPFSVFASVYSNYAVACVVAGKKSRKGGCIK